MMFCLPELAEKTWSTATWNTQLKDLKLTKLISLTPFNLYQLYQFMFVVNVSQFDVLICRLDGDVVTMFVSAAASWPGLP